MKNISISISALAAALLITAAGCRKTAGKEEGTPNVDVAEAFTDSITLYKTYPGTVDAGTLAEIVAQVNGRLLTQNFTGGSYVKKGQTLFTIESTTYRDAVTQAESALKTAESEYDYYSKQYAAMKKALEADAVSKMEVLQAQSNMEKSLAAIQEAKSQLSTAQVNLSHCTVTAPISGYITTTEIDPGNYISGEGAPVKLATVYDNADMVATFSLSDSQYEELIGKNGGVGAAIYRNVPLKFREPMKNRYTTDLFYAAPSVDAATGTVTLKGNLKNVDNELKSGMYVTISLPYGEESKAILVKDASIGTDQLGRYLYTVNDSNKVVYTPIEVGDVYRDSLRVVTSGIRPGQKYVTKALLTVHRGETINPILTK